MCLTKKSDCIRVHVPSSIFVEIETKFSTTSKVCGPIMGTITHVSIMIVGLNQEVCKCCFSLG